uniref:Uncharacterized protein n=1 Tax=virus sp. ctqEG8 TaxID=2827998 RepID=A0A8S5RET2_9VIRU|nr:MAG TPA: hypothetical protein [virus sp. ctqEG8]
MIGCSIIHYRNQLNKNILRGFYNGISNTPGG